jgi:CheY-like chemotaxis protein
MEKLSDAIEIDSITDPKKAVEKVRIENYDCIITDFFMPKLNGIKMAEEIRKFSDIPIILYTGHGSEEVAEKAFKVGIQDYVRKELDFGHYFILMNKVMNLSERSRTFKISNEILKMLDFSLVIIDEKYDVINYNDKFRHKFINNNESTVNFIDLVEYYSRRDFRDWLNNIEVGEIKSVFTDKEDRSIFVEFKKKTISI